MRAASFCWETEKVLVGALLQIETEIEIEIEYVKSLHTTRKINEFVLWKQKTGEIWKIMQLQGDKKQKIKASSESHWESEMECKGLKVWQKKQLKKEIMWVTLIPGKG